MVPSQESARLAAEAQAYLAAQLGPRAPTSVDFVAMFDEAPLETEPRVALFRFRIGGATSARADHPAERAAAASSDKGATADCSDDRAAAGNAEGSVPGGGPECAGAALPHYVAVGGESPNYFPAYGLDAEDAFSLYIGTVFMLELGVTRADPASEPPGGAESVVGFAARQAPGLSVEQVRLDALFRTEDVYFGVYRATVGGRVTSCVGALPFDVGNQAATPAFYERVDLPAPVLLRLHLGRLIRQEARSERGAAEGA